MADTTDMLEDEIIDPVTGEIIDQKELAERLLAQAKEQGVSLTGPGGLLSQLTKNVLETALDAELTEHLGHDHGGEYLKAWGPGDIAVGGRQYCRWGPAAGAVGAAGPRLLPSLYRCMLLVCSRMLCVPVSTQMVLWTMRSMMASAWTPEPRRWCQSFLAYWVQNTVEAVS